MTNNVDRAAEVIQKKLGCMTLSAEVTARRLAAAGVLADDLPTPNRQGRWKVTTASFGSVTTSPAGEVVLDAGNFRDMHLYLNPAKARDLANTLKAAADHAEKEKK